MITVFTNKNDEVIQALKAQTYSVDIKIVDFSSTASLPQILEIINSLPNDSWISFISGIQIPYRNKYDMLIHRAANRKNVAAVYSDFEVFNTKTQRLEKILVEPYNIRTWGEKFIIPLDGIFLVEAIKEAKVLPDNPKFWQNILQKYTFFHCPQFLTMVRA